MFLGWTLGVLLAAPVARVEASCGYGTILQPREDGAVKVNKFGYFGATGPASWKALDPAANSLCETGQFQSPVNLIQGQYTVVPGADVQLDIPDLPEGAEFENLGTTVEVIATGGNMSFGGVDYSLRQFHFHTPSEHLDNGVSMDMEMHMVWQAPGGQVAVIGVFVDLNSSPRTDATWQSPLLQTVFDSVGSISRPGTKTQTRPLVMSELVKILSSGTFQTYRGSLTTPPCSEGVTWLVSNQKLSIPVSTFAKARSVLGYNSRFPQNNPGQPNVLVVGRTGA
ncbi:hypothetical protein UVI_02053850 [Ustilaginoidea virens]|uniref:carbonic anhydrase n=1 Tax=Ustilaginoidea virens TaxID=1159556 RepID=A0A1B5KYA6_USTVR|nr:hypothetical protein UVI_02053850 [Ustilaginoidea virens]